MIWHGIVPSAAALLDPCSSPTVRIIRSGSEGGDLPEVFVYNVYVDLKPYIVHLALAPVPVWLRLSVHRGSPVNCPFETLLAAQELTNQLFRISVYRRSLETRCPLLRRMARPSELRHSAPLTRKKAKLFIKSIKSYIFQCIIYEPPESGIQTVRLFPKHELGAIKGGTHSRPPYIKHKRKRSQRSWASTSNQKNEELVRTNPIYIYIYIAFRFKGVGWSTQNRVPLEFSQRLNGLTDPEQSWSRLGTPSDFNAFGWPRLGYNDCRQFCLTCRMFTGIPKWLGFSISLTRIQIFFKS